MIYRKDTTTLGEGFEEAYPQMNSYLESDSTALLDFRLRLLQLQETYSSLSAPQGPIRFNLMPEPYAGLQRRKFLLRYIKYNLLACRFLSTRPAERKNIAEGKLCRKQLLDAKDLLFKSPIIPLSVINSLPEGFLDTLASMDLVAQIYSSPQLNLQLLAYTETCSPGDLRALIGILRQYLLPLSGIKNGVMLLQNIINRNQQFLEELTMFATKNLKILASKDFSCRLLRVLVKKQTHFRLHVTRQIQLDFAYYLSNFQAIFLVTEVIRESKDMKQFDFIVHTLGENPRTVLSCKHFKRVLITFAECCNDYQLRLVVEHMDLKRSFQRIMNDKLASQIFTVLVERNVSTCFDIMTYQITHFCEALLKTRNYVNVLLQLLNTPLETAPKFQVVKFCARTAASLANQFIPSVKKEYFFLLHLYCALNAWDPHVNSSQANSLVELANHFAQANFD